MILLKSLWNFVPIPAVEFQKSLRMKLAFLACFIVYLLINQHMQKWSSSLGRPSITVRTIMPAEPVRVHTKTS